MPPMCAARGKIILTLALHTILYLHPKFHEIIFHIDQATVFWSSPPIFPPYSPRVVQLTRFTYTTSHIWLIYIYIRGFAGRRRRPLFNIYSTFQYFQVQNKLELQVLFIFIQNFFQIVAVKAMTRIRLAQLAGNQFCLRGICVEI